MTDRTPPKNRDILAGKRILHVINSDGGGGVEHLSKVLAHDQESRGAATKTLFLYPGGAASKGQKITGIFRAARDIARFRPDMLVTFQPTSSVIASLAARLAGCRARIIHQSNRPHLPHWLPRLLDRLAGSSGLYSVIIMNSAATREAFQNYPARYRSRLRDISHGVAWSDRAGVTQQKRAEIRTNIRAELGISPDADVLFSCARLSAEKSLETIIETLPDMPSTVFLLAGDGAHKQVLQDLADRLGVRAKMIFLGHIDQQRLPKLYLASDIFVFPSKTETFGMAAVEAAMAGMVIVASDIPTVREVLSVGGQRAAILVSGWDAKDWQKTLSQTLAPKTLGSKTPGSKKWGNDIAASQAEKLAPEIRAHYSTEKMLEKYAALYQEILP